MEIRHDDGKILLAQKFDRLLTVLRDGYLVSLFAEFGFEGDAERIVIINHKYGLPVSHLSLSYQILH